MAKDKNSRWSLLSRLRNAVKKVTVLMNLNLTQFRLVSMITNASSRNLSRRRIQSFNYDRRHRPGLTAIAHDEYGDHDRRRREASYGNHYYNHPHKENYEQSPAAYNTDYEATPRRRSYSLQRTTSFPEEDDVDKRADMFIENFYRQLRMQRQVSLELRYKRSDASFGESTYSTPTYASPSP